MESRSPSHQAKSPSQVRSPSPVRSASYVESPSAAASSFYDDLRVPEDGLFEPERTFNLPRVFPLAFSMLCILLLVGSMVKCVDVTFDSDFSYWAGRAPRFVTFAPLVLIVLAHLLHVRRKGPNRVAVLLALFGSSLCMLTMSIIFSLQGGSHGARFSAKDCTSFKAKYALEIAWRSAAELEAECVSVLPNTLSRSLPDCDGYADRMAAWSNEWPYLQHLEERHGCGGWCEPRRQLWGFDAEPQTSCSQAVGEVMLTKVKMLGLELMVYWILVLIGTSVTLSIVTPKLAKYGIDF